MQFRAHEYQKYCIKRLIEDEQVALFLDCG